MLQFLYRDKLPPSRDTLTPQAGLGEPKERISLAKHYGLPGLQEQIVELVSNARILAKVAPSVFFDWAEDMWHEELGHDNGPFKGYLAKAAPVFIQDANEATMKELFRIVKQGGGFAEQLFITAITVHSTLAFLTTYPVHKLTVTGAGHVNQPRRRGERRDEGDTCSSSSYQKQGKRSYSSTSS